MTEPQPVRIPKKGGGDYRLAVHEGEWRLTDWTKGFGRSVLHRGSNMLEGPPRLLDVVLANAVPARQGICEAYARLLTIDPAINRQGFRAGWHERAAAGYRNDYRKLLNGWYQNIAVMIKVLQVAEWPLDVENLAAYAESALPSDITA